MPQYFELEVSLQFIQPRIWRRFLIHSAATFGELHYAIQESFGWQDSHLYEFRGPDGEPLAGVPEQDLFPDEVSAPDAAAAPLRDFFGAGPAESCEYIYDFGDDWRHEVKLVATREEKERFERRLLGGDREGPPEDCGSVPGYERILHFFETGEDLYGDDPEELAQWLGGWRPDAFVLASAKKRFDR